MRFYGHRERVSGDGCLPALNWPSGRWQAIQHSVHTVSGDGWSEGGGGGLPVAEILGDRAGQIHEEPIHCVECWAKSRLSLLRGPETRTTRA